MGLIFPCQVAVHFLEPLIHSGRSQADLLGDINVEMTRPIHLKNQGIAVSNAFCINRAISVDAFFMDDARAILIGQAVSLGYLSQGRTHEEFIRHGLIALDDAFMSTRRAMTCFDAMSLIGWG